MARFSDAQVALGQFRLPFGTVAQTISHLAESSGDAEALDETAKSETLRSPRFFQTAGPCDLVLALEPRSFRELSEVTRPLFRENLGTQWSLGKEISSDQRDPAQLRERRTVGEDPLSFIFFLRIHRSIFRKGGAKADNQLIQQIEGCLLDHASQTHLLAGLGWADYIAVGNAISGRQGVFDMLECLLGLRYEGISALQRSISLVGYEWSSAEPPNHSDEIPGYGLKIRLRPSSVGEVYEDIRELCLRLFKEKPTEESFLLSYTGGKRDIVFVPREPLLMKNLFLDLSFQRQWIADAKRLRIEHVETNCLVNLWREDDTQRKQRKESLLSLTDPAPCSCRRRVRFEADLEQLVGKVPPGILQSIHGIYSLFEAALNDPYKCCDISSAILSCDGVLKEITEVLKKLWPDDQEEAEDGFEVLPREEKYRWRSRLYDELKIWCSRAEKVIAERCAGSFESKLVPSPALSSHRGHVNKILVTADLLIRQYVERIAKTLKIDLENPVTSPAFHLGATDQIESDLQAGVVTLPSKYMFSLALAIPQLWTEAGVRIFNQIYSPPFRKIVTDRVHNFKTFSAWYEDSPHMDPERKENTAVPDSRKIAQFKKELVGELADHYADLLVRFFGFETTFSFNQYLISLYAAAFNQRSESQPVAMTRKRWQVLLQRLVFVYETSVILQTAPGSNCVQPEEVEISPGSRFQKAYWPSSKQVTLKVAKAARRQRHRNHREARATVLFELIEKIINDLEGLKASAGEGSGQRSWPWPSFDNEIRDVTVQRLLSDAYYGCHWHFMWDFIDRVLHAGKIPSIREENPGFDTKIDIMKGGTVADLDQATNLNGYFARGHLLEAFLRRRGENVLPAGMAALGRSVLMALLAQQGRA